MNVMKLVLPAVVAATLGAQQPAPAAPAPAGPNVGDIAPDFDFTPITKDGIQGSAKKLSAYRGQTVVIWFFFRARTRG